jgi:tripeptide aminopeptidase
MNHLSHDLARAEQVLLELLAIAGPSGQEGAVAEYIIARLQASGIPAAACACDDAHTRINGYGCGNLIVRLPGTRPGPGRLFSTHMDTVPLCAGARPEVRGARIFSKGPTALGGDDRTGCAALVTLAHELQRQQLAHPPLVLLFTVGEEQGLLGARQVRAADLAGLDMGFNIDSGEAAGFIRGAIGMHSWRVEIEGIASHAGVLPHKGVSAALIAARAIADVDHCGWFGRIDRPAGRGTSNIGRIEGGLATNEVMRHLLICGESRSHDPAFLAEITAQYSRAFANAAKLTNDAGSAGQAKLTITDHLPAYAIDEAARVCQHAARAAATVGLKPHFDVCDGGLDASFLSQHVPTITFGAGQHEPHSLGEYIELTEFHDGCRLALALATL